MHAVSSPNAIPGWTSIGVDAIASPLGTIHVAATAKGVCAVAFDDRADALEPRLRRFFGHFFRIERGDVLGIRPRLSRYFGGDLDALCNVPMAVAGTPMQWRVWQLVRALVPGEITTYAALSERIGMPRAQRAVGVCLASNPIPLFVPCHRVVAASGGMGSHPAGIERKRWLLGHEGVLDASQLAVARVVRRRLKARDRTRMDRSDIDASVVAGA